MKKRSVYKAVVITLSFLLVSAVIICTFGLIERHLNKSKNVSGDSLRPNNTGEMFYYGERYLPRRNLTTLLILGIDSKEGTSENRAESQQSDFIMLMVLDDSEKTYKLIQINRDTMTEIRQLDNNGTPTGTYTAQLTLAHTYGGTDSMRCRNSVHAVKNLLYGVDIDHYLSVTMDAVPVMNDRVGGVTLELMDDFTHISPELVKGESVTLMGEVALAYVQERGRLEDSSNLNRMERQKQYLSELVKKIGKLENEGLLSMLNDTAEYTVSDCSINKLSDIFESVSTYTFEGITLLEGEAVKGEEYIEYYIDEEAAKKLVVDTFYIKAE